MKSLAPGPLPPAHTNKYDDWLAATEGTITVARTASSRANFIRAPCVVPACAGDWHITTCGLCRDPRLRLSNDFIDSASTIDEFKARSTIPCRGDPSQRSFSPGAM